MKEGIKQKVSSKFQRFSSNMVEILDKPELIFRKFWKRYEKWVFLSMAYIGIFLMLRWIGKSNALGKLLALAMLVFSPFFFLWILTKFIPEIKVKEKTLFSSKMLNFKWIRKYGLKGFYIVTKEIVREYPTGSAIIGLIFLFLLLMAV